MSTAALASDPPVKNAETDAKWEPEYGGKDSYNRMSVGGKEDADRAHPITRTGSVAHAFPVADRSFQGDREVGERPLVRQ